VVSDSGTGSDLLGAFRKAQPFFFATHVPGLKLFHYSSLWRAADEETGYAADFVPRNPNF